MLILHFRSSIPHTTRTIVVTSFVVPSIISILVIYCKIFHETLGNVVQVSPPALDPSAGNQARKSSKTVGLIIGVQMISFVPSFCLNIVQALSLIPKNVLIHGIFPFAEAAAFMNAVLDPMIYFWRNREERRSLKELRPHLQTKNTSVLHLTSFGKPVSGHWCIILTTNVLVKC